MLKEGITIFTPTYNRAYILENCYKSLLRQTDKRFVWIIVDDGSTDNTEDLVKRFIEENKVDITYIKQENKGKPSAVNVGIEKANTELWVCVDSDDYLSDDAVEIVYKNYETIKNDKNICGVLAIRTSLNGEVIGGKKIPQDVKFATLCDIRYKYNISADPVFFFKTEILKNYRYPIIDGEKFIGESYVYDQIDQKYKYLILQNNLYYCEYLEDGLTRSVNNNLRKNCKGYTILKKQCIKFAPNFKIKIKQTILYTCGCIMDKDSNFSICIKNSPAKTLTLLLYPMSTIYCKKRFLS